MSVPLPPLPNDFAQIAPADNAAGEPSPAAWAVPVCSDARDQAVAGLPEPLADLARRLATAPEFDAKPGSVLLSPPADTNDTADAPRVMLIGLGPTTTLDAASVRIAGAAMGRAANEAKLAGVRLAAGPEALAQRVADWPTALAEGAGLGRFRYAAYAGAGRNAEQPDADTAPLVLQGEVAQTPAIAQGLARAQAVNTARFLAACPPNAANPQTLADWAQRHAAPDGLKVQVLDEHDLAKHNLQGLLSVGRAGSAPPRLVILDYPGQDPEADPVCLVGKGVTFDTGGYSLKTRDGMAGMKYDKCGATAVLGLMPHLKPLGVTRRVIGLAALAENMVDSAAYRPDDILTLSNGVTVEITNTDAEGRLCLADALAYACQTYTPAAVVDLATLTGGVVVALGPHHAGLWCNNAQLREQLRNAADTSGEALWELPLTSDHRAMMSGQHADLVNSAPGRACHATQGAAFLSHFVGPGAATDYPASVPWAHLDIAGTAHTDAKPPVFEKGPTGFGVRLLIDYLLQTA
ncbi:MAG: leucyl aminopeptidase family protein [Planctomycetota bacterium]